MKKIYLIAVVLITAFWGCQDDDYDKPNSFSDVGFYHSLGQGALEINVFDKITFANLSQNYSFHEWTIDEGNFFIEGPFTFRDSSEIYEQRIINPGDTTSQEKTITVYFKQSGQQKVRLFNIFDEYVEFRGFSWDRGGEYIQAAENVAGKWVIDTTLTVKVYDTIVPEIEVRQAGALLDLTTTDTIYVEAGDDLEFTDKTTIGEPTNRFWFIRTPPVDGVEPETVASSNQEVANIVFKKLGVYQGGVTVSRTGQNIPGDSDRLIIQRPFKVIPSSKPFVLTGNIAEQEDETIRVPFNGEFTPFFNKEAFFEVKVNDVVFPISSVAVNADDATFLDIVLEDPIYRPDVITVSLLDGSGIESTDTRTPVSFTDEPVVMHDVNLLPAALANVEDGAFQGDDSWRAWWSNDGTVESSQEQAANGTTSIKTIIAPGQGRVEVGCDFSQPIILDPDANYIFKYKRFIDASSTLNGATSGFWFIQNWAQQGWSNFNGETLGQWNEKTIIIKQSQPISQIYFRAIWDNGDKNSTATIYYDDFYLVKEEIRP
ncbi:hypothetical protein [Seonamhaeicola marinus]|uniref:Uncharacterized protein n=1 Tax=Seonamhaeicola marinus TaxID=1912246 RepID=A0A5D0JB94_9FLAO|nr:hypothetical protein [Seonamhaeicola marinus]TYA92148.1 hypothetical protein FUA24_01580 [Seonamhaeicola marinus]